MAVKLLKVALKATLCGIVVSLFSTMLVGSIWMFYEKMDEGKIGAIVPEDYQWVIKAALIIGFLLGIFAYILKEATERADSDG